MRQRAVVVGGQVVAGVERAGARARGRRARGGAHARVAALRALVVGALHELVAVVRQVVLRAAPREGRQVEPRLAHRAREAGRVRAPDHLALRVDAQDEGERARVVVARDGRVDAARAVGVEVGQQAARVGRAARAAGLVEAEVAQVAAARAAAPLLRRRAARGRRGRPAGRRRRGRARRARGRARRVDVALRELELEPLRGLVEAGRLLGEHEVRVDARGRGVCGGARGSVCVRAGARARVRVRGLTWRARARPTRRRSGSARAPAALRIHRPRALRRRLRE